MKNLKLPLAMRQMLVDEVDIKYQGVVDDWGNPTNEDTYHLTKVRIDESAGLTAGKTEAVRYSTVVIIYPDYTLVDEKEFSLDLSLLKTDSHWLIEVNGEPRTVVNVDTIRQISNNNIFSYELELS